MDTLPDYLGPRLRLISIGLNPSPASVAAGFYFAHPRNRFWPAVAASRLVGEALDPGLAAMQRLFCAHRIGFTDLIKRPTAGAKALRGADYRAGAQALAARLEGCDAPLLWFHGRLAWRAFLRHALGGQAAAVWGLQPQRIGGAAVFVTPNPSPANAAFSLDDLVWHYRELARCLERTEAQTSA